MKSEDTVTQQGFDTELTGLIAEVEQLPRHDDREIAVAADRLSMLEADLSLPFLESDPARLTRDQCVEELRRIRSMDRETLSSIPGIEESMEDRYGPGADEEERDEWMRYAKLHRAKRLARTFKLINRLRNDEPEAWDEIEELYFDD